MMRMWPTRPALLGLVASALCASAGVSAARAQSLSLLAATPSLTAAAAGPTVINLISAGGVSNNISNSAVAFTSGGLFAGAVSALGQQGTNQLNIYGASGPATLATLPLLGGAGQSVTLTMSAGATAATPVSLTVNNINSAVSSATNPMIGATALVNMPYLGGYGGAAAGAAIGGVQAGGNSVNGTVAAFAPGTLVTLSQTGSAGGALASLPNLSVINTMLGYSTGGGASVGGVAGAAGQSAGNTVNAATVGGMAQLNVQQLAPTGSGAAPQSINQAFAFSVSGPTTLSLP